MSSAGPRLVLASGSPRRREVLSGLGAAFEVRPVDIDESPAEGEAPDAYVLRLARSKAIASVETGTGGDEIVLAADTIVVLDGALLGKPRDAADAKAMLERLSGRWHEVLTGVAVHSVARGRVARDLRLSDLCRTRVRFAGLSAKEIDWYVGSGEPLDKAGAYGIQGLGALFVDSVEGNYSNVVGLPLPLTYRLLREAGFSLLGATPESPLNHRT